MRIVLPSQTEWIAYHRLWHAWFAWFPVRVDVDEYRWLETVDRRGGYDHGKNRAFRRAPWRWQYRALGEDE